MKALAERTYFLLSRVLGRLLRSGRYAKVRSVGSGRERHIRKNRLFYAPLLISAGAPLLRILDAGVRVLAQREWEQHERLVYWSIRGTSIRVDDRGGLVLPFLPGRTLAELLEQPEVTESRRHRALELAVSALVELHRLGFTHGDAMAENVLIDLEAGAGHWFDFETVHDADRSLDWRRADDLRALLCTCLVRTPPQERAAILRLILSGYGDEQVRQDLAANFSSVFRRPLAFHLAQAPLSFGGFRQIAGLLREHVPTLN